ncbi:MAG: methyltransferase domain-containing protein [Deltaproteobacteria bacterium]|nr:methyltransferase domain-containing protein [Deltaproteobacteria bacterium]
MFENVYENTECAEAYAKLRFPGTYFLAFRDLPAIFGKYIFGRNALDFGCGTGRSTRFLRECGFQVVGVDISAEMLNKASELDPAGNYRLIAEGDLHLLEEQAYNLVLCAFPFDNIPNDKKPELLIHLGKLLMKEGKIVILGSTPEIYLNEWVSFSTVDFPQNRHAKDGDTVEIINTALADRRPAKDILCSDKSYREIFGKAGLDVLEMVRPLARLEEPFSWVRETEIPPWVIYILRRMDAGSTMTLEPCKK